MPKKKKGMRQTEAIYMRCTLLVALPVVKPTNDCVRGFPQTVDIEEGSANHLLISVREHVYVTSSRRQRYRTHPLGLTIVLGCLVPGGCPPCTRTTNSIWRVVCPKTFDHTKICKQILWRPAAAVIFFFPVASGR